MDFSHAIEEYIASAGNSDRIDVYPQDDGYIAEIYYGDEEISNYLGDGATTTLYFSDCGVDSEDNSMYCHCKLISCVVPGLNLTEGDNPVMAAYLLEEVARAVSGLLSSIDIDQDIWISLS